MDYLTNLVQVKGGAFTQKYHLLRIAIRYHKNRRSRIMQSFRIIKYHVELY